MRTRAELREEVERRVAKAAGNSDPLAHRLGDRRTADVFLHRAGAVRRHDRRSVVSEVTGVTPELSTTGGTSDARFIKDYCPVIEFGLMNGLAHKVDEHVADRGPRGADGDLSADSG